MANQGFAITLTYSKAQPLNNNYPQGYTHIPYATIKHVIVPLQKEINTNES